MVMLLVAVIYPLSAADRFIIEVKIGFQDIFRHLQAEMLTKLVLTTSKIYIRSREIIGNNSSKVESILPPG